MKPSGSASRKKSRSAGVSVAPEQPKMAARGSRLDKDAPDAALLQLVAVALRRGRIGDRPGLNAIVDAARAEIGALRVKTHGAEQICLLAPEMVPLLLRGLGRAHGAELEAIALAGDRRRWRRRGNARHLLGFRLGYRWRRRARRCSGGWRRRRCWSCDRGRARWLRLLRRW